MAEKSKEPSEKHSAEEPPLFRVQPLRKARKECDDLFKSEAETLWVISQLQLLRHWPLDAKQQEHLGSDLSFTKVRHRGEAFFELRLDDAHLHQKNLRVFFWVQDNRRTIWIIHGYWKKTNRLDEAVKSLVARRIKCLKGSIQDGSVK
jgi:phage-related protein